SSKVCVSAISCMIKQVLSLLSREEKRLSIRVVATVFLRALLDFAGVAALIPILIMVMGDSPDRWKILFLCCGVLFFVLCKNGLAYLLTRYQSQYLLNINKRLSQAMFSRYYERGLLFLKSKSTVQLGYEVNFICYMFSLNVLAPMLRICSESVLLLLIIITLLVFSPLAGLLLCMVLLPLLFIYARAVKGRMTQYGKEELEARRRQSRLVVEAFRGYSELEINQAFHSSLETFRKGLDKITSCRLRYERLQFLPMLISEASIVIGIMLLLLVTKGDLRIVSGVFAVAAYRMIPSARMLLASWTSLQNAAHAIQTVQEGIAEEKQPQSESSAEISFQKEIEIRHLSFSFPDGDTVLKDFNLTIPRGQCLGIQGTSGSGKTTLFHLMLGFFPPTGGEICIDGTPLTPQSRASWHKLVGYVPQDIFIIHGSLAENIALGQEHIDREKIRKVLQQVHLDAWAEALPEGIDTPLGEYGSRLSGGQKQRIGIARALYKEAEVLFFDEATSALDNATESEITSALEELSAHLHGITLIIIAHRDSSLRFCDKIINIENYCSSTL
ncbi:MAG: ABC transporter ATP-binding protein, partial [Bacteroidaceae bacterium]|nr:ABC transporter ATP-binding protein [Bacteroidaceae bacterium]